MKTQICSLIGYAFANEDQTHVGAVPAVDLIDIDGPFDVLGARVTPVRLGHGPKFEVLGFRIGNLAYCTDCKTIPEESKPLLQGLDSLILSALRPTPHPTHMNIEEAIEAARELGARQTWFTHCSCHVDYESTMNDLPEGFAVAYDGLRIDLT